MSPHAQIAAYALVIGLIGGLAGGATYLALSMAGQLEQQRAAAHALAGELAHAQAATVAADSLRQRAVAQDAQTIAGLSAQVAGAQAAQPGTGWLWQWATCGGPCKVDPRGLWNPIPDTFDVDVSFTATTPVTLRFYSLTGRGEAVSYGPALAMQHVRFAGAEGCGGYAYAVTADSPGVIFPSVWVRYNPAPALTGVCGS